MGIKPAFFALAMLLLPTVVLAQYSVYNWVPFDTASDNTVYYASNVQHLDNGHKRAWIRAFYGQPEDTRMAIMRWQAYQAGDTTTMRVMKAINPDARAYNDSTLCAATVKYEIDLEEFDCVGQRVAFMQADYYYYDDHSKEGFSFAEPVDWRFIIPESLGDMEFHYVCSH